MGFPCRPTSYDLVGPVGDSIGDLLGDSIGDLLGNSMGDPVGDSILPVVSFDPRHFSAGIVSSLLLVYPELSTV